ncbi:sigma-70 family RNA polymerase sigma factor [Maritimibacter alkaliphilus]|uniref:sigma-70 family RNA polymerase sigma factor n=1 Tax=Maritimibacter alkaliphilus TaxID=404236 RepID=UPI0021BDEB4C|nr:sigma-70 family RNA polymerase sigma factor [Maritimibacter alkaliphilus]
MTSPVSTEGAHPGGRGEKVIETDHSALLIACASGDRSALKAIVDAEGGRMLGVARRMLRRSDLAEDAVQDALVLVWRRAGQFDPARGSAKGWLYTILRNRCLTMLRSEEREVTSDAADVDLTPVPEVLASAYGGLDDATGLRQCLDRLDGPTRDAILASYVLGYSHGEIAGRLDSPLGTIKARMRRGLLKLRECLS